MRIVAANLRRAYSAEPLKVPDAMKAQVRRLKDVPEGDPPERE